MSDRIWMPAVLILLVVGLFIWEENEVTVNMASPGVRLYLGVSADTTIEASELTYSEWFTGAQDFYRLADPDYSAGDGHVLVGVPATHRLTRISACPLTSNQISAYETDAASVELSGASYTVARSSDQLAAAVVTTAGICLAIEEI